MCCADIADQQKEVEAERRRRDAADAREGLASRAAAHQLVGIAVKDYEKKFDDAVRKAVDSSVGDALLTAVNTTAFGDRLRSIMVKSLKEPTVARALHAALKGGAGAGTGGAGPGAGQGGQPGALQQQAQPVGRAVQQQAGPVGALPGLGSQGGAASGPGRARPFGTSLPPQQPVGLAKPAGKSQQPAAKSPARKPAGSDVVDLSQGLRGPRKGRRRGAGKGRHGARHPVPRRNLRLGRARWRGAKSRGMA